MQCDKQFAAALTPQLVIQLGYVEQIYQVTTDLLGVVDGSGFSQHAVQQLSTICSAQAVDDVVDCLYVEVGVNNSSTHVHRHTLLSHQIKVL
jgi:hypothetical protein